MKESNETTSPAASVDEPVSIDMEQAGADLVRVFQDRYVDSRPRVEVDVATGQIHLTIYSNDPLVYYIQWMTLYEDGRIVVAEPDDGCTSINAAPRLSTSVASAEQLVAKAIELTDAAVAEAQLESDRARKRAMGTRPQPDIDRSDLSAACTRWQGGAENGSSLLRAAARVLAECDHYFKADFITAFERRARSDVDVLSEGSWLLSSLKSSPLLTADEWNRQLGLLERNFAGRGVASKTVEDPQILKALKKGTIEMPLWGVSLDPAVAQSYGGKDGPRFMFQIDGPFPAIPAWTISGIKPEEQELICGGKYEILSVSDEGPVTRVRLGYIGPIGLFVGILTEDVGSDRVLLETISKTSDISSSGLGRRGLVGDPGHREKLVMTLRDGQRVTVERHESNPETVKFSFEPHRYDDGWATPEYATGETATGLKLPANATLIAQVISVLQNSKVAEVRQKIAEALIHSGTVKGEPWESTASIDVLGGYVQWTRVDNSSAEVHLEVSDTSDYAQPLSSESVDRLMRLGWNAPQEDFRNCWTRFDLDSSARDLIGGALWASNRVVLAATIGLGNEIGIMAERIGVSE